MRSFGEFVDQDEQELTEGALRGLSAAVLFTRIWSLSKKVKRSKDIGEKLDLIASQNTHLAALGMAVGRVLETDRS